MKVVKHQTFLHGIIEVVSIFFLLIIVACLVSRKFRGWVSDHFSSHPIYFWSVPVFLILFNHFFLVMTGRGQQSNFLQSAIYFGLPSAVLFYRIGHGRGLKPELIDCGLALWLWLPMVTGLVANNIIYSLSALVYSLLLFSLHLELNLSWQVPRSAWRVIAGLAGLWSVLLLVAWAIGLIPLVPTHLLFKYQVALPVILLLWFFGQSLFGEFLFRGVIQSWFGKHLPVATTICVVALFSGIPFLNMPEWAFPNWSGAALATVIGSFCGYAYYRTGSIMVSAILNTALNFSWWMFFRGGW